MVEERSGVQQALGPELDDDVRDLGTSPDSFPCHEGDHGYMD